MKRRIIIELNHTLDGTHWQTLILPMSKMDTVDLYLFLELLDKSDDVRRFWLKNWTDNTLLTEKDFSLDSCKGLLTKWVTSSDT